MGMIAGLLLGNIENMTAWIFCGTAGVFLYVALVDMIPELNSGHAHPYTSKANVKEESQTLELILQLLGMSVGIGIMLLIALYEHDLKNSFN